MHLTQIKAAAELKLNGVTVEFTTADNSLREVVLTCEGHRYLIQKGETYSENLRVYRADKFKQEERHVLEGDFCGIKIRETFENSYEADRRLETLNGIGTGHNTSLTVVKKSVPIDLDTGAVAAPEEVPF